MPRNVGEVRKRQRWNARLSSLRISIEHAFGLLKKRFPVLRSLPGRRVPVMITIVEVCMILHNILIQFGDNPDDLDEIVLEDAEAQEAAAEARHAAEEEERDGRWEDRQMLTLGKHRREQLRSFAENQIPNI